MENNLQLAEKILAEIRKEYDTEEDYLDEVDPTVEFEKIFNWLEESGDCIDTDSPHTLMYLYELDSIRTTC